MASANGTSCVRYTRTGNVRDGKVSRLLIYWDRARAHAARKSRHAALVLLTARARGRSSGLEAHQGGTEGANVFADLGLMQ
jgi:hypothetical protein